MLLLLFLLLCIRQQFALNYAINSTVTLSGIPVNEFNVNAAVKLSFSQNILSLVSGVVSGNTSIMNAFPFHACEPGMSPIATETHSGYTHCSGKNTAHNLLFRRNNTNTTNAVVHYQLPNISHKHALTLLREIKQGVFHESASFLPVEVAIRNDALEKIANIHAVRIIGNVSFVTNIIPSREAFLIPCNYSYNCIGGRPVRGDFCQLQRNNNRCQSCESPNVLNSDLECGKVMGVGAEICAAFGVSLKRSDLDCKKFHLILWFTIPLWLPLVLTFIWCIWSKTYLGPCMRRRYPFHWELMYGNSSKKVCEVKEELCSLVVVVVVF